MLIFQIYGWIPEYYKSFDELPKDMPEELKNQIANITDPNQVSIYILELKETYTF